MTEDEALTKWCPFARRFDGGFNRFESALPRGAFCVASACMAWRWDGTHVNDPDDPKADLVWSDRSYGHCGLAGESQKDRAISLETRQANVHPQAELEARGLA